MSASNGLHTFEVAGARVTLSAETITAMWLERLKAGAAQPSPAVGPAPKIGEAWQGGIYAGLSLKDGQPVHLVLLPGELESTKWQPAMDWAAKQGGVLPSRIDQLVLLQNLKSEFKAEYYWSAEQHSEDSDYAWYQGFGNGYQYYDGKGGGSRARAVRQIAV